MVPVRALSTNAFGDKMKNVSKWHCEKTVKIIVNGSRKNTQFNNLPKSRIVSEVISPISLGMEPVKAFSTNAFGGQM